MFCKTGDQMSITLAENACTRRIHPMAEVSKTICGFIEECFTIPVGGSIGALGIKKRLMTSDSNSRHNTQSFALAHMSTGDKKPNSVMPCTIDGGIVCLGDKKPEGISQSQQVMTLKTQLGLSTRTMI